MVSAEVGISEQLSVDIGANLGLSVGSLLSVDIAAQVEVDVAAQVLISELLSLDSYAAGLIRGWLFANGASPLQWFSKLQVIFRLPSTPAVAPPLSTSGNMQSCSYTFCCTWLCLLLPGPPTESLCERAHLQG